MLRMLQKYECTDLAAIVTRYYGGVQLGIRGLIDAYSAVVESAILAHPLCPLIKYFNYIVDIDYQNADHLKYHLQQMQVKIKNIEYSNRQLWYIAVEEEKHDELLQLLEPLERAGMLSFLADDS